MLLIFFVEHSLLSCRNAKKHQHCRHDKGCKTYIHLQADSKLLPLEEKWFYPDNEDDEGAFWEWALAAAAMIVLAIALIYLVRNLHKNKRSADIRRSLSRDLAQHCADNKVRVWTYHVGSRRFTWHDEKGKAVNSYTKEEFAKRYNKEDFLHLKEAIDRLVSRQIDTKGHEEQEETQELKAMDMDGGDGKLHDFVVVLSVLDCDSHGKPSVILCTKRDVTKEHRLKQLNSERSLRFWSMFYNDKSGVFAFGSDGCLQDVNAKGGELFKCDVDKIVEERVHINTFFHTVFTDLCDADGFQGSQTVGTRTIKYQMKTVCKDDGSLLGIYVFCI